MEVLLHISDNLKKYIEYIPEEVLPAVLNELLKNSIKATSVKSTSIQREYDAKLNSILETLKELQSRGVAIQTVGKSESVSEPAVETTFAYDKVQINVDSDLGDLLDLLK